jgi:ABC-type transport system involved in multi-copper enzyme maturation permease subunit
MAPVPILWREMRAESRRSITYWLRLGGAALAILVVLEFFLNSPPGSVAHGDRLFYQVNRALFISLWIVGPILTGDCISREKRDGTLGLLFLTRLTPGGIALGKGAVHLIRGISFLVAIAPVLILPLLLGGVSRADLTVAVLLDLSALLWALSAGIIASTFCRDWVRALLLGEAFSLLFAFVFASMTMIGLEWAELTFAANGRLRIFWQAPSMTIWQSIRRDQFWYAPMLEQIPFLLAVTTGGAGARSDMSCWSMVWTSWPVVGQRAWIGATAALAGLSWFAIPSSLVLAAVKIRHSWQDQPVSVRQLWLLNRFCTPRFWRSIFRSRMTRKLDRNPIGWLQQASWQSRLVRWGWCLLVLITESNWFMDASLSSVWAGQFFLAYLLLFSLAFTASTSFRIEQETGALELLLVTPIRERQIILGRLQGIWSQFFPASIILAIAWVFLSQNQALYSSLTYSSLSFGRDDRLATLFLPSYLVLGLIGLYFSMRIRNPVVAWLLTLGLGLIVPLTLGSPTFILIGLHFIGLVGNFNAEATLLFDLIAELHLFIVIPVALQLTFGILAWILLERRLRMRAFGPPRDQNLLENTSLPAAG